MGGADAATRLQYVTHKSKFVMTGLSLCSSALNRSKCRCFSHVHFNVPQEQQQQLLSVVCFIVHCCLMLLSSFNLFQIPEKRSETFLLILKTDKINDRVILSLFLVY